MKSSWIIMGASSPIAKAFIELAAPDTRLFVLVGRDEEDLKLTAEHIQIKYHVPCEVLQIDLTQPHQMISLKQHINTCHHELSLFLAHTTLIENNTLTEETIDTLIKVNFQSSCQIVSHFVKHAKKPKTILYLSSVAGERGRSSNSLYGATKKALETFLEGLKVKYPAIFILSLRLGFIDTSATYGKPGIFLAKSPEQCAAHCYKLCKQQKTRRYFPWFWRYIMTAIKLIPDRLYKKLSI